MENNSLQQQAHGTEVSFVIPDTESLGMLKEMKEDFLMTMKYKKADDWAKLEGVELRAFYMGLKDIPNKDGEAVSCGVFVTEKECFLSGQLTLIESVKYLPCKTPISITYKGKRPNKSSVGDTMIFDVSTLK